MEIMVLVVLAAEAVELELHKEQLQMLAWVAELEVHMAPVVETIR